MVRQFHQPLLVEQPVLRQHALDRAAQRTGGVIRGNLAANPALHEAGSDPVPDRDAGDVGANPDNLAGAVGEGDEVGQRRASGGAAGGDHQVSVIQRGRAHPHQHLAAGGAGDC
jgi:hypothetical protein